MGSNIENNNEKILKVATVFSGIGAPEQALNALNVPYEIVFACDNGERSINESYEDIKKYAKSNKLTNKELNEYVSSLYDSTKKPNRMKES